MIARFRVLESGHVLEQDDPTRDPRLVGKLPLPSFPPESPVRLGLGPGGVASLWTSSAWGELVADCPCEDCLAQRELTSN
jgi:hypothetical protein